MKNKTSEAQLRATRKWVENNPEHAKYLRYRRTARTFIRHHATLEDMAELNEIFEKENEVNK